MHQDMKPTDVRANMLTANCFITANYSNSSEGVYEEKTIRSCWSVFASSTSSMCQVF